MTRGKYMHMCRFSFIISTPSVRIWSSDCSKLQQRTIWRSRRPPNSPTAFCSLRASSMGPSSRFWCGSCRFVWILFLACDTHTDVNEMMMPGLFFYHSSCRDGQESRSSEGCKQLKVTFSQQNYYYYFFFYIYSCLKLLFSCLKLLPFRFGSER